MKRRDADAIAIPGDYQARALQSPRAAQRFWHAAKIRTLDRLAPPRATSRVADAGCGSGVISAHVAATAREVVGFDSNPAAIEYARSTYASPRLRFVLGPFSEMAREGPFDQIYCLEVLEHLYEQQARETLAFFAQSASPGADLFLTTPNARSAWPFIEWTLDALQLVPTLAEAQHLTLFTHRTLQRAVEASGWQVVDVGAFNGIAPFLAPLSEPLARATERLEARTGLVMPYNLLYCRAQRR